MGCLAWGCVSFGGGLRYVRKGNFPEDLVPAAVGLFHHALATRFAVAVYSRAHAHSRAQLLL
jgi:hypothetical protein